MKQTAKFLMFLGGVMFIVVGCWVAVDRYAPSADDEAKQHKAAADTRAQILVNDLAYAWSVPAHVCYGTRETETYAGYKVAVYVVVPDRVCGH